MKEDEEVKQGFIIKDRRRFDDTGADRETDQPAQPEPARTDAAETRSAESAERAEITFSSFVVSLATQALMQLGEIKPPSGVNIPVDVESAQRTIDLLSMLKEKTEGNLNDDESGLLEEVLHTLRMSFVKSR